MLQLLLVFSLFFSSSLLAIPDVNKTGTIRLFAAIDTNDPNAGLGCRVSWDRLEKFLLKARPGKDRLEFYRVPGRMASLDDVVAYYTTKIFKKNDVLWFLYCGHGFTGKHGHALKMDGELTLPREDLLAMMEKRMKKGEAQGVLVTTDACATKGNYDRINTWAYEESPAEKPWELIASLIGNLHGTVNITAATGERPAFVDIEKNVKRNDELVGALFTQALISLLQTDPNSLDFNKDKIVDWNEAFAFWRATTQKSFNVMHSQYTLDAWNEIAKGVTEQTPFAHSLGNSNEKPLTDKPIRVDFIYKWPDISANDRYMVRADFNPNLLGHEIFMGIYLRDKKGELLPAQKEEFSHEGKVASVKTIRLTKENLIANANSPWEFEIAQDAPQVGHFSYYYNFYVVDKTTQSTLINRRYNIIQDQPEVDIEAQKKNLEKVLPK